MTEQDKSLMYGPDDKISHSQSFFLGLQHVLAMDVYVPPVIIASILAIGMAQKTSLIQATFFSSRDRYNPTDKIFYEDANFSRSIIYTN